MADGKDYEAVLTAEAEEDTGTWENGKETSECFTLYSPPVSRWITLETALYSGRALILVYKNLVLSGSAVEFTTVQGF